MGNLVPLLSTRRSKFLNELPAIDIVTTMRLIEEKVMELKRRVEGGLGAG